LIRFQRDFSLSQAGRPGVEQGVLVLVHNPNFYAYVSNATPRLSFDRNTQFFSRIEFDARAAFVVHGHARNHDRTVRICRASFLAAFKVFFDDLRSRPDHLHRAFLQQQAAFTQVRYRA
jgi:hypothetical protein